MLLFLYSLGPGVLLRTVLPRGSFSLTAFVLAAAVLQIEPLVRELAGNPEARVLSWTLVGPPLIAGLLVWGGAGFIGACRRLAWKTVRPHAQKGLSLGPPTRTALASGALAGGLVNLFFAALDGQAGAPFWPLLAHNPLAGVLTPGKIHQLSALFWPLSLVLWGFHTGSGWGGGV